MDNKKSYTFAGGPIMASDFLRQAFVEKLFDSELSLLNLNSNDKQRKLMMDTVRSNFVKLLNIPNDYHIWFSSGGIHLQFAGIAMSYSNQSQNVVANYTTTGWFSRLAFNQGKKISQGSLDYAPNAAYTHFVDNQTVQGLFFQKFQNHSVQEQITWECKTLEISEKCISEGIQNGLYQFKGHRQWVGFGRVYLILYVNKRCKNQHNFWANSNKNTVKNDGANSIYIKFSQKPNIKSDILFYNLIIKSIKKQSKKYYGIIRNKTQAFLLSKQSKRKKPSRLIFDDCRFMKQNLLGLNEDISTDASPSRLKSPLTIQLQKMPTMPTANSHPQWIDQYQQCIQIVRSIDDLKKQILTEQSRRLSLIKLSQQKQSERRIYDLTTTATKKIKQCERILEYLKNQDNGQWIELA